MHTIFVGVMNKIKRKGINVNVGGPPSGALAVDRVYFI